MKIAIYGDSFVKSSMSSYSWPEFLKKDYDVIVDAAPGASIEYVLKKFNENQQNFDKIIIVLTEPSRIFLPNHPHFQHMYLNEIFIKNLTKDISQKHQKEILEYFYFHTKYVHDEEVCRLKYLAFNDYILKKRPDVLILPAFTVNDNSIMPLSCISNIDTSHKVYGRKLYKESSTVGDPRPCHMSVPNNLILSKKIKKWIKTGKFSHLVNDYVSVENYEQLFKLPIDNIDNSCYN